MREIIPFISQYDGAREDSCLAQLALAMPGERIASFRTLDDRARQAARLAIVANPRPEDVALFPHLVLVQSLWAGVERLVADLGDRPFAIARLVDPNLALSMAEAVLTFTLYLHREVPGYARQQRQAVWHALPYKPAGARKVGVLGLGKLGEAAAHALRQAGFVVSGWSRSPKALAGIETFAGEAGLERVISQADILVCLLPLTAQTRGLIDAAFIARMKQGASLINFARGAIINAPDLLAGLDAGQIKHAVLDVFEVEPLPSASPFWAHPGVTVLPHISAETDMESASAIVAATIARYRQTGLLPETVDKMRGY